LPTLHANAARQPLAHFPLMHESENSRHRVVVSHVAAPRRTPLQRTSFEVSFAREEPTARTSSSCSPLPPPSGGPHLPQSGSSCRRNRHPMCTASRSRTRRRRPRVPRKIALGDAVGEQHVGRPTVSTPEFAGGHLSESLILGCRVPFTEALSSIWRARSAGGQVADEGLHEESRP